MPGHNGGIKGRFFLDTADLVDDMERRMDALGWDTAHIVGNSLGGWVAFELARRGRARTLTGIAPAGGWTSYTPAKFEIVFKFLAGLPVWLGAKAARPARPGAALSVSSALCRSARPRTASTTSMARHHRRRHPLPGLLPAADQVAVDARPAGTGRGQDADAPGASARRTGCCPIRASPATSPSTCREATQVTHLDGVGHIPMFEAPRRVADLIVDFVDRYATPPPHEAIG